MTVRRVPGDFRTIQAAVDASGPGDTVRVAGGIYAESVTIGEGRDRLAILGAGRENTVLRGGGTGVGFAINGSPFVTIAGFTVTGSVTGIQVATDDNIVREVTVTGCGGDGITVLPGAGRNLFLRVASNHNGADGIEISGAANFVVECEFQGYGDDGIDINASNNLVVGTRASGNGSSGLDSIGNNTFLVSNHFTGNARGVRVVSGGGTLVLGNSFSRNQTMGADFANASGGVVLGNEVSCNLEQGLRFDGGGGFRVLRNRVERSGAQGIDLAGSVSLSVVDDNRVEESDAAGIRVGAGAAANAIRRNCLVQNRPDLEAEPPADRNNVFDENRCESSRPRGLCPCDG